MAKNPDRELRDLLESTQAEVKRLKAELNARAHSSDSEAQLELAAELQGLRARLQALEKENVSLRAKSAAETRELLAAAVDKLTQARRESLEARDEAKKLKKRLEATTQELARTKAKLQRLSSLPDSRGSLRDRVAAFFSRSTLHELERAQKEITRLNQQLSLVQVHRRRGR